MYIVEVKGNVIIEGGNQRSGETILLEGAPISQSLIEKLPKDYSPLSFNRRRRVVEGNLFLSEKRRYIPYATYLIHGDEIFDERAETGESWIGDGVTASCLYWKESVERMKEKVLIEVPPLCRDTFYNGLFVECFSALELLLSNIVFSLIYSKQLFFDRAVQYWGRKSDKPIQTNDDLEYCVHEFFATRVYHQFDVINALFKALFNFYLPDYAALDNHLHRRNNIVHRHSISNLDWMTEINASPEDVADLIKCSVQFGDELVSRAEKAVQCIM